MSSEIDGVNMTEWGAVGPTVVLVHGGTPGGGSVAFAHQAPLSERWRLVLPDRPGHGQSPPQGPGDFEHDAVLLSPLLDERAHLVGHSYGGIVALYMAASRPDKVASLTLIEPPAFCFAKGDPEADEMARKLRRNAEDPHADPVDVMRTFFALVGLRVELPDPVPEALVPIAEKFKADMTQLRSPDEANVTAEQLTTGGYPLLVLTSGNIGGFERVAEAIARQTGATHVVVPGTAHAVQDDGEQVNPLLEELWLQADG
jgi:pimeloyl-ACP methyl ester carboxylesterase